MGTQVASKRKISSATAWRSEAPNLPIKAAICQSGTLGEAPGLTGQTQWSAGADTGEQSGQVMGRC